MTPEEYKQLLGLDEERVKQSEKSSLTKHNIKGKGRSLVDVAEGVDHAADGFMGPVKN
jgi:hypothetical protein